MVGMRICARLGRDAHGARLGLGSHGPVAVRFARLCHGLVAMDTHLGCDVTKA